MTPTWSAPVRFAEVDAQGIVFNSHYLLYCDEAVSAFFAQHDLTDVAANIRLVASSLTWSGSARWGETVAVVATCTNVGRTSFRMSFEISAGGRLCCSVETTYVLTDADARPTPLGDEERQRLQGH